MDLRPFRFTKNSLPKFFNVRSRDSANNLPRNRSFLTLGGYAILQQISLMNNGVLEKIEETPAGLNP
jgi:hypothetical protein